MTVNESVTEIKNKYKIVINNANVVIAKIQNVIDSVNALKAYVDEKVLTSFNVDSINETVGNLQTVIDDLQTFTSNLNDGFTSFKETTETNVEKINSSLDAIKSSIDDVEATVSNFSSTYVTPEQATAISVDSVNTKYNSFTSTVADLRTSFSSEVASIASEVEDLKSYINDPDSGLNATAEYLSSIYTEVGYSEDYDDDGNLVKTGAGLVKTVEDLTVSANNMQSEISNLQEVTEDHSEQLTSLTSELSNTNSNLSTTSNYLSKLYTSVGYKEETDDNGNLVKTGEGLVKTVEDLTVRTNDAESNIENLQEVTSNHAEQISTLTTKVDDNTTTISEVKSVTDNIATASVLITDSDGYITGYRAVGSTDESTFDIYANKFSVTDGNTNFTPFSISGSDIYFNGKVTFSNIDTEDNGSIVTTNTTISGDQIRTGVIYGGGDGTPDDYKMKIDLTEGYIYIK